MSSKVERSQILFKLLIELFSKLDKLKYGYTSDMESCSLLII